MNHNYNQKDLDALLSRISTAINAVQAEQTSISDELSTLINIAEAAKDCVRSAKNGQVLNSDFLNALLLQSPRQSVDTMTNTSYVHPLAFQQTTIGEATSVPRVKDSMGKRVVLGKCLGRGGEGSVYKIPSLPGKVAKIYFQERLTGLAATNMQRKITALSRKKRVAYINETLVASIPDELLFFQNGTFAGYVMPQFTTTTKIFEVQRDDRRRKLFPDLDYRGLIAIAYNLAEVVDHLHKNDIVVGDMNHNNILIHQDGTIALIDCDSFDITDTVTGDHFPCTVGLQELLAPEIQTVGSLKNGAFTKESDNFSLAIHIFRLLMNNADPFAGTMTTSTSLSHISGNHAILMGECAYVRDVPGKEIPRWSPTLDILPKEIQELFRRVFDYTAESAMHSIHKRPSAAEWMKALQNFYQMPMTHCKQNSFHWYLPHQCECPFCARQSVSPWYRPFLSKFSASISRSISKIL